MRGKFSLRKLFGKPKKSEVQNDGHQSDGPSTPPILSGLPGSHDKTSIAQEPSPTSFVDREDGVESASNHAARAQVPPSALPVASAEDSPAEPDSQTEDPQPAADFEIQLNQTISTSQRLWNEAYDSLENETETAELVKAYLNTLATVLSSEEIHDTSDFAASDLSAGLKDPTNRQAYMKKLVEEGRAKVFKASKITQGVGDVAEFILSAKGLVDTAIQNIPQAALPWAGVCVGLQILLNPAKAMASNLTGIVYTISRMDWYCGLVEHLLNKESIKVGNESFEAILQQLEIMVVTLYKALILYQMKSACSYYRNQGLVFLRNLANLDDWDGDLKNITDAEAALQSNSDQYNNLQAKSFLRELVTSAEKRQSILGDIHQDLRDFIAQQQKMQADSQNKALLRDLFVVDPQAEMETIETKKDKLVDEAYKWILHTKEYAGFTDWSGSDDIFESSSCRLLWIKGPAGTGKTMLLIGILRQLSYQPCKFAPGLSYFFCQGTGDKALNNPTAALRSLIWLLLIQQPHLIPHLKSKYEHAGPSLFNDRNAFSALSDAFMSMLKDPSLLPTYLVVDALDECAEGVNRLIELISSSLALSDKVKWLVSSRPEIEVKNPNTLRALVELDSQSLKGPVNTYIDHKLVDLRGRDGYDDDTLARISSIIRQRATNTFLWVALVFKALYSVEGWDAANVIEEMPSGLSELYDHTITRIGNERKEDQQRCKNVLVAAVLAYRPLSLSELTVLAGLSPNITPETIIKKCGSFLVIENGTVYLIHQSAKDYLEKNYTSKLQESGIVQGHEDIARRSIDAMKGLKKNIYNLQHVAFKSADLVVPSPDPLKGLRYCCVYWVQHFQKSSIQLCDNDDVYQFLKVHLMHWLEALCWIGKISEGILAILLLEEIILIDKAPNLHAFIYDAKRFALQNRALIEQTPLQLYCSALIFAPKKSIIRRQFEKDIPAWIETKIDLQENWDSALQTLEGHTDWVITVAFSPDGKTVVSGSNDKTVRLWDATTSEALYTLSGHTEMVVSVAFSPDNTVVASCSKDETVRLWDVNAGVLLQTFQGFMGWPLAFSFDSKIVVLRSGENKRILQLWNTTTSVPLQTLNGHTKEILSAAFSPSGKVIASCSEDETVRLWDIATGTLLQTLNSHTDYVRSVAFSPSNKIVASCSDDNTVRLWEVTTGVLLQTLKGHTDWVRSVTFSPDGKQVVSASDDRTVRFWNTATGAALYKLQGHVGYIYSVAFSASNNKIASASSDNTIRLWDIVTQTELQIPKTSALVKCVAFSSDGKQVVSGSDDRTVRLWDVATGAVQTLEGHTNWVRSVAFSPGGKQVVSGSYDRTVRLWDIATGAVQTLEGHTNWVNSVAFSPGGKQVVSGSYDRTVRLWDIATGAVQTFEGHTDWVRSVAFSPDGKQVVSGSDDSTVRLWDIATSAAQTLKGHTKYVFSVAFSPDSKQVASGSRDRTVRLWDVATSALLRTINFTNEVDRVVFLAGSKIVVHFANGTAEVVEDDTQGSQLESASLEVESIFFASENNWVVEDGRNVLWLPPKYRPILQTSCPNGIALAHKSGGVSIFKFQKGSRSV